MRHSRAYYVVLVGIGLMTLCEPFTSKAFIPKPIDGVVDVIWMFVQGAGAFCVGADVYGWLSRGRTRWSQR